MPEPSIEIRRAGPGDAPAVAEFARRTFIEAFGADNRPEDLAAFVASSYGVEKQGRELSDPDVITIVAESGGLLAGYAQVRRNAPPACVTTEAPVELWRFYVDRPWHGRGLAQRLMAGVREAARELGGPAIWLSVWERNPRGIAFYAKCGFRDVGTNDFWVGADRQTDRILVAEVGGE